MFHEIAHILQNTDRRSKQGIMKARWNPYDFTFMKRDQLGFTDQNVEMIHEGLAARAHAAWGLYLLPLRRNVTI